MKEAGQVAPGHSNQKKEEKTPYLITDQTIEELDIEKINHFNPGLDYIENTDDLHPSVIETPDGLFCIDGYEVIKQAKEEGKTKITCNVRKLNKHDVAELTLRKLEGRIFACKWQSTLHRTDTRR